MKKKAFHHRLGTLAMVILAGCFSSGPPELNLAFRVEDNQLITDSVQVDGQPGRFVIATGTVRTVIDAKFDGVPSGSTRRQDLLIGGRKRLRVKTATLDLKSMADGMLGADVWRGQILTLDYRRGLATIGGVPDPSTEGAHTQSYSGPPSIVIHVDGRPIRVIVDTAVPDTIILPAKLFPHTETPKRMLASVEIAGVRFDPTSILVEETGEPRMGNRMLAHFLVTIDDRLGNVTLRAQ